MAHFFKAMRLFALGALLAFGAGCHSYGGKTIAIGLDTNPRLTPPTDAVAYVVTIEKWNDIIGTIAVDLHGQPVYSLPESVPPQGFTPAHPVDFANLLELYRVKEGPPPVETRKMPYHAIYVVKLGDKYYWNDITPTFNGDNTFTVKVPDDVNNKP